MRHSGLFPGRLAGALQPIILVVILVIALDLPVPDQAPDSGYCLAVALGPDEYLVADSEVQVTFSPNPAGPPVAGLLSVEEGTYLDGRWIAGRRLNGDEVQLRYDLSEAAASNQSAAGLRFGPGAPTIQRARLYRYR